MDNFTKHYLITALWSTSGDKTEYLDENLSLDDISEETKIKAQQDCDSFRVKAGSFLDDLDETVVAHDFWLTRNGHGAGFWDGDYDKHIGEKLTLLSEEFGQIDLYVGDDGKVYHT